MSVTVNLSVRHCSGGYRSLLTSSVTSVVSDSATHWAAARQAPLSMDSSGKNTGVDCRPPPEELPNPGIKQTHVPCVSCSARGFLTAKSPGKPSLLQTFVEIHRTVPRKE